MKKLKKVSFENLIGIFKFLLVLIPAFIVKHIMKKDIWLVSEHYTARDNGYFFYKFLKEKHPEINCFYSIDLKSPDYKNIMNYRNIIKWGSIKHYFYYMSSSKLILSHKNADPNHPLFAILLKYFNVYNNIIFLQHGITKDDVPNFYYKNAKFKLFICGAKPEYEYVIKKFGYPEKNAKYTGFARFDNLHDIHPNKKLILFMPTWRRWINNEAKFVSSDYYKRIQSLINSKELNIFLKENNITLLFCPHFGSKDYVNNFSTDSNNIKIINPEKANIQELLINTSLLITDYSSVSFDYAYMRKPVVYYQFDVEEYREKHLTQGYFKYEMDGFGKVINKEDELINEIKRVFNSNCEIEKKYKDKINKFFPLYDKNNSERIFEEIMNL